MATYPTPEQIDAAIPANGTPNRALTNTIFKGLALAPEWAQVIGKPSTFPPIIGTTPGTAKSGDYVPSFNEIEGVPAGLKAAQAAGTASVRAIGTTATTAAAGNHTHGAATSTNAGFMSAADKAKLDAIQAGGGSLTPTAAPTITIGDPVDDENVQASFDALINALKAAGVLT